eukprot:gene31194-38545_t
MKLSFAVEIADSTNTISTEGEDDGKPVKFSSPQYINTVFSERGHQIHNFTKQCMDMHSRKFNVTYPALTIGDVRFVKNKAKEHGNTKFKIGIKLGLVAMMLVWIACDYYVVGSNLNIWEQPGLYVYTIVGNLLLYRVLLAANIYLWCKYNINYMSIFQFDYDTRPNLLLVLNHSSTSLLLFVMNLTFFFEVNIKTVKNRYHVDSSSFLANGCPVLLIVCVLLHELYTYLAYRESNIKFSSRGVFSMSMVWKCVFALCIKEGVTFRASYVANILTSFTKIYSDFMHALCWIISGSFLMANQRIETYGSDLMTCNDMDWNVAICVIQVIPQCLRIMQSIRSYQDKGEVSSLVNISKYCLTNVVIIYGLFQTDYSGTYLVLAIILAGYKWFWDVYMNWGMFEVLPSLPAFFLPRKTISRVVLDLDAEKESLKHHRVTRDDKATKGHMFLRKQLMFHSPLLYYVAIVLNLLLRFLWVVSLLPSTSHAARSQWKFLSGIKLGVFLASMEIFCRSIWGLLRVEYEHLKFANAKTPGFLAPKRQFKYESQIDDNKIVGLGNKLSANTILKQLSGIVTNKMPFARPRRNSRYGAVNPSADEQQNEGEGGESSGIAMSALRGEVVDIETGPAGAPNENMKRNISDELENLGYALSSKENPPPIGSDVDSTAAATATSTKHSATEHLQAGYIPSMPGRACRQSSIDTTYEDDDERYSDYDMQQYFVDRDVTRTGDVETRERYNSEGEVENERDRRDSENEEMYEEQTAEERDRKDTICHGTVNKTASYNYVK